MTSSASSMMPSIAGQSTAFTSAPCILNTCSRRCRWVLVFIEMGQKTLLELLVGCLFRHFRKRLHQLLLGIIDVLQLMHEQVVHGLDVFGKESHCGSFFFEGTH